MDNQDPPALPQSSAVRAFDALRGEVSLLRRAIEGLAAERHDQPDYGPTLEALATSNEEIRAWAKKINDRPAMQLTPQRLANEIEAAASRFRQQARQAREDADARMEIAINEVKAISQQARTSYDQVRRVKIVGGAFFLGGFLLGLLLVEVEVILALKARSLDVELAPLTAALGWPADRRLSVASRSLRGGLRMAPKRTSLRALPAEPFPYCPL